MSADSLDSDAPVSQEEWDVLTNNQCPLPPRTFWYTDSKGQKLRAEHVTAWFYKNNFWIQPDTSNEICKVILSDYKLEKYKNRVNQMRTVDEYISSFGLTTSLHIYRMLTSSIAKDHPDYNALSATFNISDDKDTSSELPITQAHYYARKFSPSFMNRFAFFLVICRGALNAFFIIYNFRNVSAVQFDSYKFFVFIVSGIEALLWFIAFIRLVFQVLSLIYRLFVGDTYHFQVKNIPENLRQLSTLSVMRYLPNGESAVLFKKRVREWIYEKKANYKFEVHNSEQCKFFVALRWVIMTILDVICPVVAIFSLLFKMSQFDFVFDKLFSDWDLTELILYFAFVNQVSGIRKVRKIETEALQHFIFSGSDVKLSEEENLLINAWWSYTIVSCVSNISREFMFPVFDSMVFYYSLNVRRLQLLFKDHKGKEGKQYLTSYTKKEVILNIDTKKYDQMVKAEARASVGFEDDDGKDEEQKTNLNEHIALNEENQNKEPKLDKYEPVPQQSSAGYGDSNENDEDVANPTDMQDGDGDDGQVGQSHSNVL